MKSEKKGLKRALALSLFATFTLFAVGQETNKNRVRIDQINFPDDILRSYVSANYDKNQDGILSEDEIASATELKISNGYNSAKVQSLKGVEYLPNLVEIVVEQQSLKDIDVSNCTKLETLKVANNKLTRLDVSKNTCLRYLHCNDNSIKSLAINMSETPLVELWAFDNYISGAMDFSENTSIQELKIFHNNIAPLILGNKPNLRVLECNNNGTHNGYGIYCAYRMANKAANELTTLDVSGCNALESLACGWNFSISALDVSDCKELQELSIEENSIKSIDVSQNPKLRILHCNNNSITNLDLKGNAELKELDCSWNMLTKLDVTQNKELMQLTCGNNAKLTALDVTNNSKLTHLHCSNNQLTELDVTQNKWLKELDCSWNLLTELDLSQNTSLTNLNCGSNEISQQKVVTQK
jgi:hypothetical protein